MTANSAVLDYTVYELDKLIKNYSEETKGQNVSGMVKIGRNLFYDVSTLKFKYILDGELIAEGQSMGVLVNRVKKYKSNINNCISLEKESEMQPIYMLIKRVAAKDKIYYLYEDKYIYEKKEDWFELVTKHDYFVLVSECEEYEELSERMYEIRQKKEDLNNELEDHFLALDEFRLQPQKRK